MRTATVRMSAGEGHRPGETVKASRICLAIVLAMSSVALQAQNLPRPREFYFDDDASVARPIVLIEQAGDGLADELVKAIERGRKPIEATAQLAHIAMESDRLELGKSLYQQALAKTQARTALGRSVRWNFAWDLFRKGDAEAALQHWRELAADSIGEPSWIPPTLALALWTQGHREEAVRWYAAAVRTEPDLWNDPVNFAQLLPAWQEQERSTLAQVQAAWQAAPPAWP